MATDAVVEQLKRADGLSCAYARHPGPDDLNIIRFRRSRFRFHALAAGLPADESYWGVVARDERLGQVPWLRSTVMESAKVLTLSALELTGWYQDEEFYDDGTPQHHRESPTNGVALIAITMSALGEPAVAATERHSAARVNPCSVSARLMSGWTVAVLRGLYHETARAAQRETLAGCTGPEFWDRISGGRGQPRYSGKVLAGLVADNIAAAVELGPPPDVELPVMGGSGFQLV